jgi:ELWxxDGT repeat protein
VEGRLFFSAQTAGHGREAWMSNGKPGGTVMLGEVAPGVGSSDPSGFIRSGWDVFFSADDGAHGRRLWALPMRPSGQCGTVTK